MFQYKHPFSPNECSKFFDGFRQEKGWLVGWLVFDATFSTNRPHHVTAVETDICMARENNEL